MKNIKRLVICLVLVFSVFSFVPQLHADSGFDSGWSSGGSYSSSSGSSWSSGSSSWDYSSSSSSYRSSSGGSEDWGFAYLFCFSLLYLIIVLVVNNVVKINKKSFRYIAIAAEIFIYLIISVLFFSEDDLAVLLLLIFPICAAANTKTAMIESDTETSKKTRFFGLNDEDIKRYLGENFDKYKFYKDVFKIYKDVQIAWMNKDIDSVRNVLTDEMYNMYRAQVETLKIKSQTNVMEDIEYIYASILGIKIEKDKKIVSVLLNVKCKDYLVDKDNNVIKGYRNRNNDYTYRLTFISTNEKENICPNCGAKVENSNSSICDYCHSSLVSNNYSWTLSKKEMIRQR